MWCLERWRPSCNHEGKAQGLAEMPLTHGTNPGGAPAGLATVVSAAISGVLLFADESFLRDIWRLEQGEWAGSS